LRKFYKALPIDKYQNLLQKGAAVASLSWSTYICEETLSLLGLNSSNVLRNGTDGRTDTLSLQSISLSEEASLLMPWKVWHQR
jgi:hypothetical protein